MKDLIAKLTQLNESSGNEPYRQPPTPAPAEPDDSWVGEAAAPGLDTVYPNTREGVLQYMQYGYDKSFLKRLDLPTCNIHQDREHEGVWAVDSMASGFRCIIYLAGYPEGVMGKLRQNNDNEEGGFTMRMMKEMVERERLTPKLMKQWVKRGGLEPQDMDQLVKHYNYYHGLDEGVMVDEGSLNGLATVDEAHQALTDVLSELSPDDPYEVWEAIKGIAKKYKTPTAQELRKCMNSCSPDDGNELWEAVNDIANGIKEASLNGPTQKYNEPDEEYNDDDEGVMDEGMDNEGISEEELAGVLFDRLEARKPEVMTQYGDEAVWAAVEQVASFHAGATELGTSDINIMLRDIMSQLAPKNEAQSVTEVSADDDEALADFESDGYAMSELMKLPQPIGVNGGSYLYRADVTKQPLVWKASDGSVVTGARTLRDIGEWLDDSEGWYDILDGNYDIQDAIRDGVIRLPKKRNTPWSDQEEHEMDNMRGESIGEGAKVDRMVGHVKSSEKKLGKSDKDAENIAWATANKRGMLDNKNKKTESVVTELSPDTHKSYQTKADQEISQHQRAGNKDKMAKRAAGFARSLDRLPMQKYTRKASLQQTSEGKNMKKNIKEGYEDLGNVSPELGKILRHFGAELKAFQETGELHDHLYDALYDYYFDEMPYGTKKARDGDPYEWISDRLDSDMNYKFGDVSDKYMAAQKTGIADEGAVGDVMPLEAVGSDLDAIDNLEDEWYDDRGNVDPNGSFDAGGHYDHARGTDKSEYDRDLAYGRRDITDEDSVDPEPLPGDKKLFELRDIDEAKITDILSNIGLDHGLDFWFEGNEIVVIGRKEAKLVTTTVGGHIQSADGEEYRIGANKRPVKTAPSDIDDLVTVPRIFDSRDPELDDDEFDIEADDEEEELCAQCSGSGEGMYDGSICHRCGGSGVISNRNRDDDDSDRADYLNDRDRDDRMTGDDPRDDYYAEGKMSELDIERQEAKQKKANATREKKAKEAKEAKAKKDLKEEVSADDVELLTMRFKSGQMTYDEFRDQLDSLEQTDYSMRQGEMGMQGDDTPAGHRHFQSDQDDYDEFGVDDEFEESTDEIVNRPAPEQLPGFGTAAGDKDRQGRRQPMTAPGNNPMAEARKLMSQYNSLLASVKK